MTNNQQRPLDRAAIVQAGLALVQEAGLDALTMRALGDRLGVKAASLYWHVRDRDELLDLVAEALLSDVPALEPGASWRAAARDACVALQGTVVAHRDSARLLLDVPGTLERSRLAEDLRRVLAASGLTEDDASDAAAALLFGVLLHERRRGAPASKHTPFGAPARCTIESPSRGVTLRAGTQMDVLARAVRSGAGAPQVRIHGDEVAVRRMTGARQAVVELDPARSWSIRVGGGAWSIRLRLSDLDLVGLKLDGGATRVDCILPAPRGVVPIDVSGGAVAIVLHRPPGASASAHLSAGALQVRLDGAATRIALIDSRWESVVQGGTDRYELDVSAGAIQVTLDAEAPAGARPAMAPLRRTPQEGNIAIDLLLEGIERRLAMRA